MNKKFVEQFNKKRQMIDNSIKMFQDFFGQNEKQIQNQLSKFLSCDVKFLFYDVLQNQVKIRVEASIQKQNQIIHKLLQYQRNNDNLFFILPLFNQL